MTTILSSVITAVVCLGVYILITRFVTKKNLKSLREAARKEAEAEGEMIKKEKILQAKEKFIQLKSEHDRQVNERNQKVAQMEAARQADREQPAGAAARTGEQDQGEQPPEGADGEPAAAARHEKGGGGSPDARTEHPSGADLGHELRGGENDPDREYEGRGQDRSGRLHQRDDRGGQDDRHEGGQTHHRRLDPACGDRDGDRERRYGSSTSKATR